MRFPKVIRHRKTEAKIYGKSKAYPCYRVAWRVNGQRRLKSFASYSAALAAAESLVREVAAGSPVSALSAAQARDALAACQRLESHRLATGRSSGLLAAVSAWCEADARLKDAGVSLAEAAAGFLSTAATVTRKDLSAAAEEFIRLRAPQGVAKDGKRPARSPVYLGNVAGWLREFAAALPGHAVSDLTKSHLDVFFGSPRLQSLGTKSRNDRRAALRMFFDWCAKKDWLPVNHRLLDADGMARESVETKEPEFYSARELRRLLDAADATLRPILALQALAGLRVEETMRLEWPDVFRVAGHVEVRAAASKVKQRRLVPVCDALAAWLACCRDSAGQIWPHSADTYHARFAALRESAGIPTRENGLRHGYASHRYALTSNENLVAAEMGTSAAMLFRHYRGLCTPQEGGKWFAVAPAAEAQNIIPLTTAAA